MNIVFLHHSTGNLIWNGSKPSLLERIGNRLSSRLGSILADSPRIPSLMDAYNDLHQTNYSITEMSFPKSSPYGWNNYPYDYYNIWVKNAGEKPYMEEPTLEMLTKDYQVIIFKHCYPASNILPDLDSADINSNIKTLANYKLQYNAIKSKLNEFPQTKFILFTGAVQVQSQLSEEEALRAKEFRNWVVNEWDQKDDNVYIWDLYDLQTEGGLYFKDQYARSATDSHPGGEFSVKISQLLFDRIIDVVEKNGETTDLTGKPKK